MSDHTPGPWKVVNPRNDPNAYDIAGPKGQLITRGYWAQWAKADARLIAAAPELLAALKRCIEIWLTHAELYPHELEAIRAAEKAIAKAEGK